MRKLLQKKVIIPLTTIIILVVAFGIIRGRNTDEKISPPQKVAGVSIETIETKTQVNIPIKLTGQVKGKQSTTIRALVDGTVQSIVPVGTKVERGAPLFRLLNQSVETAYQSALNSFTNAQASSAQTDASTTNARNQSQIAVDQAKANLELSITTLRDGETTAALNFKIAKDTAQITYLQGYNTLDDVMRYLGESSLNRYAFDNVLSADQEALFVALNQFFIARDAFLGLPGTTSSNEESDLQNLKSVFTVINNLNTDTSTLLNFTVIGNNLTSSDITAAKSQVAAFRVSLNALQTSIANNINNLENVQERNKISVESLKKRLEIAKLQQKSAESALESQKTASTIQKIGASSSLSTAQSGLATARRNFQNLQVPAPFAGTVISHQVNVGSQATPGQSILEIGDLKIIEIKLNLASSFAEGLLLGQSVKIDGREVGRISEIEPAASLSTGKIGVTVEADNADTKFIPGSVADLEFDLVFETNGVIIVPLTIVKINQDSQTVLVVRDGKVVEQPVQLGRLFSNLVEITQGLADNDQIIVENGGFLQEGDNVEIKN